MNINWVVDVEVCGCPECGVQFLLVPFKQMVEDGKMSAVCPHGAIAYGTSTYTLSEASELVY